MSSACDSLKNIKKKKYIYFITRKSVSSWSQQINVEKIFQKY